MRTTHWLAAACLPFFAGAAVAGTVVLADFEYATEDDFLAAGYIPTGGATLSLSTNVAPKSTGKHSLQVDFSFPSVAWATETVTGPEFATPVSIGPNQYLSLRLHGDPAFSVADFKGFYVYLYDVNGDFRRFAGQASLVDDWSILNFKGSTLETPWNGTGNLDTSNIVKIAFFQYGSQAAIAPYSARIRIDDVTIRDTPLVEFGPPAPARAVIDDFEGYADDAALRAFYTYANSWQAGQTTTTTLASPAPQGNKALKLAIDWVEGQYPWGSVVSAKVPAFSFPSNAELTLKFKGEPALTSVADDGTTFWVSFYDAAGGKIDYIGGMEVVTNGVWTTLHIPFSEFRNTATVDTGNLVQWRILAQGWTAQNPALSGAVYVDDLRIASVQPTGPSLGISREAANLKIGFSGLVVGTTYELQTTPLAAVSWTVSETFTADNATANRTIQPTQAGAMYRLRQKP